MCACTCILRVIRWCRLLSGEGIQREEALLRVLIALAVTMPPKSSQAWPRNLAYPTQRKREARGDMDPCLQHCGWLLLPSDIQRSTDKDCLIHSQRSRQNLQVPWARRNLSKEGMELAFVEYLAVPTQVHNNPGTTQEKQGRKYLPGCQNAKRICVSEAMAILFSQKHCQKNRCLNVTPILADTGTKHLEKNGKDGLTVDSTKR